MFAIYKLYIKTYGVVLVVSKNLPEVGRNRDLRVSYRSDTECTSWPVLLSAAHCVPTSGQRSRRMLPSNI